MLLLEADGLRKSFGERLVLALDHLEIHSRERIGLVGLNGSGKTTLMKILAGVMEADEGVCRRYVDISFMQQFAADDEGTGRKDHVSGGEKTKALILAFFNTEMALCFADEPTNHLDMDGVKLLEKKLRNHSGALLIVSHDRELLDQVCERIIEIEDGHVRNYRGNYQAYLLNKKRQQEQADFDYQQYCREKVRLEGALRQSKGKAASIRKAPRRMGNSEARLHKRESGEIQKKLARSAKSLQSRLDRLQPSARPFMEPQVLFYHNPIQQPVAKVLVKGDHLDLTVGRSEIFRSSSFTLPRGSRTALIGANGTGKTSLLRLMAARDSRLTIAPGVRMGCLSQEFEDLDLSLNVLETMMGNSVQPENTARILLAKLLFRGADYFKQVGVLSGGERVRLAIARLLLSEANLLLLDEPSNYLDIGSTEAVQQLIIDYPGTILFVSHDRQLVRAAATRIIAISDRRLITFEDGYPQYEAWLEKASRNTNNDHPQAQQLILRMRCAELAARIAKPRKSDDLGRLKQEYDELIRQMQGK